MEELLETLSGNVDPSSTPETTFKLVRAAVLACYREQASEVARLRHEGEELRSQVATLRAQLGGLRALVPALMKGETRSPVSVPEEEEVFGGIREGDDALLLRLKAAAQHEVDDARDDLESDKSGGKAAAALLAAEEAELSPRRASRSVDCDRFRGLSLLGSMLTPGEIKVQDLPSVDASTAQKRLNTDDADRESRRGPREDKGKDEEDYLNRDDNRDDDNNLLRRLQEEALQEVDATADSVKLYQYSSSEPDGSNRHTRVSSQSQLRALSRGRSESGGGLRGISLLGNFLDPYASRDVDGLLGTNMNHGAIPVNITPAVFLGDAAATMTTTPFSPNLTTRSSSAQDQAKAFSTLAQTGQVGSFPQDQSENDAEDLMAIEIEVAAKFQQIAGIYDSKPRDFAREMRKDFEPTTRDAQTLEGEMPTARSAPNVKDTTRLPFDEHAPGVARKKVNLPDGGGRELSRGRNENLYATAPPVNHTRNHRSSPSTYKQTLNTRDDYKWKQFMTPNEDEDTDSDEDEVIVTKKDQDLEVHCRRLRTLMRQAGSRIRVQVNNAKHKRRHIFGARVWRYYVITNVFDRSQGGPVKSKSATFSTDATASVSVRRFYSQFLWIHAVLLKKYRGKKLTFPTVPRPAKTDRLKACRAMSEWVQLIHSIEKGGLDKTSNEWRMFLVSSDRELELYRKKLGEQEGACAPTSAATGSRVRSFSGKSIAFGDSIAMQNIEKVRSKQRSLLATTHSWIGAAVGALDGSYHHSSIGMALGSSAFRKDQTFPIGDALELILKWDGEDIDDDTNAKTLLDAVKAETKRLQRNQAHWEKVADSLRNSSALDTKESKMLAFSRAPVGAADEKEAKLSGRLLVARLVPRHLIAGSSKPLNAAEESTLNTEIRLYAGTIVSLGRDITNDVQIRDAAASRRHGRIEVSSSGGQIYFVDLGSSNGTEIDGIQISAHGKMRLLSGTRVRIGDTYYICVENAAASQKRLLQSPGVVDQSGASGEKGAPVEKVDTGPREPDLSDLETFVRKLIAQGCGDYQSVRKSVGNRWGLSYFKSHRDFVRSILSKCDSLPPADKVTDQSLLKTSTLASLSKVEVPPLKVDRKSLRPHSNDAVGALLADLGVGDVLL